MKSKFNKSDLDEDEFSKLDKKNNKILNEDADQNVIKILILGSENAGKSKL
jgi:hypothetical protein